MRTLLRVLLVLVLVGPAWAKGGSGHGSSGGHGGSSCKGSHGPAGRGVAVFNESRSGGITSATSSYVGEDAVAASAGSRDSDFGPWIIFVWMGRAVGGAVHSLRAL